MADLSWREVQTVLDEEVQALPAKYRDAFVFCFLEDKSRKGVARELGWEEAPCRAGSIGQKNSSKSGWPGAGSFCRLFYPPRLWPIATS